MAHRGLGLSEQLELQLLRRSEEQVQLLAALRDGPVQWLLRSAARRGTKLDKQIVLEAVAREPESLVAWIQGTEALKNGSLRGLTGPLNLHVEAFETAKHT